jgi:hypothetical protein
MGAMRTCGMLCGEDGGGEIHGPEQQPGGGEVDASGLDDAVGFGPVGGEVAAVHGGDEPGDAEDAAGAGHVVQAGAGVEVMAAAGASADGGSLTVATVGKSVAAETNDQVRVHGDLRRVKYSG